MTAGAGRLRAWIRRAVGTIAKIGFGVAVAFGRGGDSTRAVIVAASAGRLWAWIRRAVGTIAKIGFGVAAAFGRGGDSARAVFVTARPGRRLRARIRRTVRAIAPMSFIRAFALSSSRDVARAVVVTAGSDCLRSIEKRQGVCVAGADMVALTNQSLPSFVRRKHRNRLTT